MPETPNSERAQMPHGGTDLLKALAEDTKDAVDQSPDEKEEPKASLTDILDGQDEAMKTVLIAAQAKLQIGKITPERHDELINKWGEEQKNLSMETALANGVKITEPQVAARIYQHWEAWKSSNLVNHKKTSDTRPVSAPEARTQQEASTKVENTDGESITTFKQEFQRGVEANTDLRADKATLLDASGGLSQRGNMYLNLTLNYSGRVNGMMNEAKSERGKLGLPQNLSIKIAPEQLIKSLKS